jgi:protein-disulfide isomerase
MSPQAQELRNVRKVLKLLFIVSAFVLTGTAAYAEGSSPAATDIRQPEFMTFGKDDAPVTIIEFSSYTCPHCAYFHENNRKWIMETFVETGQAKYIFHDYPLDGLSTAISMIVQHAPKDMRYALSELYFKKQTEWMRSENPLEVLASLASLAGMDRASVEKAIEDRPLLKGLIESRRLASQTYNVEATPTLVINGKQIIANEEQEKLTRMIEAAEAAAKAK